MTNRGQLSVNEDNMKIHKGRIYIELYISIITSNAELFEGADL